MKVLSNSGGGSESRIIVAMDAVADVVKRKRVKGPTIVSMSLGGPCADKRVTRSGAVLPSSFGALLHSSRVMSRSLLIFFWSSTA